MNWLKHLINIRFILSALLILSALIAAPRAFAQAENYRIKPENTALDGADIEQRLGHKITPNLQFIGLNGEKTQISRFFGTKRPLILALGYVECPNLCALVHQGMVQSLKEIDLKMGEDFDVLSVSIDPDEPVDLTRSARQRYLQIYARSGAESGWHSLLGESAQIQQLADDIGFHYAYDEEIQEYSHPGALIILTADGEVSRYFFGVSYDPKDLRLALVDASKGAIGSIADKILLRCFSYDPKSGKYSVEIMRILRWAAAACVLAILMGFVWAQRRRGAHNSPEGR